LSPTKIERDDAPLRDFFGRAPAFYYAGLRLQFLHPPPLLGPNSIERLIVVHVADVPSTVTSSSEALGPFTKDFYGLLMGE